MPSSITSAPIGRDKRPLEESGQKSSYCNTDLMKEGFSDNWIKFRCFIFFFLVLIPLPSNFTDPLYETINF